MIESEDERLSSEPEDNQEQVGHQILCVSISFVTCPPCNDVESGQKKPTSRAPLWIFLVFTFFSTLLDDYSPIHLR